MSPWGQEYQGAQELQKSQCIQGPRSSRGPRILCHLGLPGVFRGTIRLQMFLVFRVSTGPGYQEGQGAQAYQKAWGNKSPRDTMGSGGTEVTTFPESLGVPGVKGHQGLQVFRGPGVQGSRSHYISRVQEYQGVKRIWRFRSDVVPKVTRYKCCTELIYTDLVEIHRFLDIFLSCCFYLLNNSTHFHAVCQMYILKKQSIQCCSVLEMESNMKIR